MRRDGYAKLGVQLVKLLRYLAKQYFKSRRAA
jgi:hypothetical protein